MFRVALYTLHDINTGTMNIHERAMNISPRSRIASWDMNTEQLDHELPSQITNPRLSSASTAIEAFATRLANLRGLNEDLKGKKDYQTALFDTKMNILMKNPFLFRCFKERLAASKTYAPTLVHRALKEFLADMKIPEFQEELKKEAIARRFFPMDKELRDHFTASSMSSSVLGAESVSQRVRRTNFSATLPTKLSFRTDYRITSMGKLTTAAFNKMNVEDVTEETYDDSSDEDVSLSGTSISATSLSGTSLSGYSYVSDSGESHQSMRLEL